MRGAIAEKASFGPDPSHRGFQVYRLFAWHTDSEQGFLQSRRQGCHAQTVFELGTMTFEPSLCYQHWDDTASGKELLQRPIKILRHAQRSSRQFFFATILGRYENALGEQNRTSRALESEEEQNK